eukprot:GHVN01002426.1.p1 GENE.GHVN01002426.1~~GHVN01002426.1.p1  ORF type:complete len:1064 (+),score=115.04 GHVN01002426.1:5785-8976(+)
MLFIKELTLCVTALFVAAALISIKPTLPPQNGLSHLTAEAGSLRSPTVNNKKDQHVSILGRAAQFVGPLFGVRGRDVPESLPAPSREDMAKKIVGFQNDNSIESQRVRAEIYQYMKEQYYLKKASSEQNKWDEGDAYEPHMTDRNGDLLPALNETDTVHGAREWDAHHRRLEVQKQDNRLNPTGQPKKRKLAMLGIGLIWTASVSKVYEVSILWTGAWTTVGVGLMAMFIPIFWSSNAYRQLAAHEAQESLYNIQWGSGFMGNNLNCNTDLSWANVGDAFKKLQSWQQCRARSKDDQYFGVINVSAHWCNGMGFAYTYREDASFGWGFSGNCQLKCRNEVNCNKFRPGSISGFGDFTFPWGSMGTSCYHGEWSDWRPVGSANSQNETCGGMKTRHREELGIPSERHALYPQDHCPWLEEFEHYRADPSRCNATCPRYGVEARSWGDYKIEGTEVFSSVPHSGYPQPEGFVGSTLVRDDATSWQQCAQECRMTHTEEWVADFKEQWPCSHWTYYVLDKVCFIYTLGAGSIHHIGVNSTTGKYDVITGDANTDNMLKDSQCQVDCVMTDWSEWDMSMCFELPPEGTVCDNNELIAKRTRDLITDAVNGGIECEEGRIETQKCSEFMEFIKECPHDCEYSDEIVWQPCNVPCGEGKQIGHHPIIQPPTNGGAPCTGAHQVERVCHANATCHGCEVKWDSDYGPCDTECGIGLSLKQGVFVPVAGMACDFAGDPIVDTKRCNTEPDKQCPRDCLFGTWGHFSVCSGYCGHEDGEEFRLRAVLQKATFFQPDDSSAVVWGKCEDPEGNVYDPSKNENYLPAVKDSKPCSIKPCAKDCVLTKWSSWYPEQCECINEEPSFQVRTREIIFYPENGGEECPPEDELRQRRDCADDCSEGLPTGCVMGPWGEWSECSQPCGVQTRERAPISGNCAGVDLTETRPCLDDDECDGSLPPGGGTDAPGGGTGTGSTTSTDEGGSLWLPIAGASAGLVALAAAAAGGYYYFSKQGGSESDDFDQAYDDEEGASDDADDLPDGVNYEDGEDPDDEGDLSGFVNVDPESSFWQGQAGE